MTYTLKEKLQDSKSWEDFSENLELELSKIQESISYIPDPFTLSRLGFTSEELLLIIFNKQQLYTSLCCNRENLGLLIPNTDLKHLSSLNKFALLNFKNSFLEDFQNSKIFNFEITALDFQIIANLIVWLSSNGGRCFIKNARDFTLLSISDTNAFLLAWGEENKRVIGINHGFKLQEYLVATKSQKDLHRGLINFSIDQVKAIQIELIESFIIWLSTAKGSMFISSITKGSKR